MNTIDITKSGQPGSPKHPKSTAELAPVAAKPAEPFSPASIPTHSLDPAHVLGQSLQNPIKQGGKHAEKTENKKSDVKRGATLGKKSGSASDNVVSISENAIRSAFTLSGEKTQDMQESAVSVGLDSAKHLAKGAEVASRVWSESLSISRDHMEACAEASAIAMDCANRLSENMLNYANDAIAESVEISKRFFGCRTASDLFELHNRLAQSSVQRFLDESSRVSDMMFHMASKATEPFSEKLSDMSSRLHTAMKPSS